MILNVLFLILMLFIFQVTQAVPDFRKDYHYIEEGESAYKINTLHKTQDEAKLACERESASLYYPKDGNEALAVAEYWKEKQPFLHWIIVNINKLDIIDSEGEPVAGVYANWQGGEPNNVDGKEDCVVLSDNGTLNDVNCNRKFPFICKKPNSTIEWSNDCKVPYAGYKFQFLTFKCYKFHLEPKNWVDAYATCYGEQSYLAVVDNDQEKAVLTNLIGNSNMKIGAGETIHSGFFNKDGWRTVKGVPLHTSSYNRWAQSQPDGGINEDCGGLSSDGLLHDVDCSQKKYFICEHDLLMN